MFTMSDSMDDSTAVSRELEAAAKAAAASSQNSNSGGKSPITTTNAHTPIISSNTIPSSATSSSIAPLIQPSSFSSAAFASHPYLSGAPAAAASASLLSTSTTITSASTLQPPPPMFSSMTTNTSNGLPYVSSPGRSRAKRKSTGDDDFESGGDATDAKTQHHAKVLRAAADSDEEDEEGEGPTLVSRNEILMSPTDADEDLMEDGSSSSGAAAGGSATRKVRSSNGETAVIGRDGDDESSLMSLLSKLANLEFPDKPEKCPICEMPFPLKDFADHVYFVCLKKLDDTEKKAQEELDANYAVAVAFGDVDNSGPRPSGSYRSHGSGGDRHHRRDVPAAAAELERDLLQRFEKNKQEVCRYGSHCNRTDAHHFIALYHPEVPCPICNEDYPVYEVDAHVSICLETPKPPKPVEKDKSGDVNMDGAGGAKSSTSSSSMFSSAPVKLPSSAGSAFPRRLKKLTQRSASASAMSTGGSQDSELLSPPLDDDEDIAAADDEADDEDGEDAPSASPTAAAPGTLQRSHSDKQLSLAQAHAVAHMVLSRGKNKVGGSGSSSSNEKDPSLLELLSGFSALGFTRENLAEQLAEHTRNQEEKSKMNAEQ